MREFEVQRVFAERDLIIEEIRDEIERVREQAAAAKKRNAHVTSAQLLSQIVGLERAIKIIQGKE